MQAAALTPARVPAFAAYCRRHRSEVDESFLYDEDLRDFEPNEENPTYVLLDERGEIAGAASLILDDYNRRCGKARFRIFHSEIDDRTTYETLMRAMSAHTEGLRAVYQFVPIANDKLCGFMESLQFEAVRYSYLLVREDPEAPAASWPEHYELRAFRPGLDEAVWCEVRNAAFAALKGSETPITPDNVKKTVASEDYIEDGMMLLYHAGKPVGAVRCSDDEYEDRPILNIGPEYQGRGLGRCLLRSALRFAAMKGYPRTILCVNAENERAKSLYLQEGFRQVEAVACYEKPLRRQDRT